MFSILSTLYSLSVTRFENHIISKSQLKEKMLVVSHDFWYI